MKLDIEDPKVFDRWREYYDTLTDDEQTTFHNAIEKKYPHQKCFNVGNYMEYFKGKNALNVLEVGGWKGELAHKILTTTPQSIKKWTNYELCLAAIDKTVAMPQAAKYSSIWTREFNWFEKMPQQTDIDVFVCSHVIEHLKDEHLIRLFDWASSIDTLLLEAPIGRKPSNWTGYLGTHILEMGWDQITKYLEGLGYEVSPLDKSTLHCHRSSKRGAG